jgi:hypothetical protein
MAESLCKRCNAGPARIAICAYALPEIAVAKQLIAAGQRVSIDTLRPCQANLWTTSDGELLASDVGARTRQALDDRPAGSPGASSESSPSLGSKPAPARRVLGR